MPFVGSAAPELEIDSWINSEPRSLETGTYLLDFWSYSCRGCLKGVELMQSIDEEYPGLDVVGIHAPEFGFEESLENVRKAVERLGIDYPVGLDVEKKVWNSYGNSYWPDTILVHNGEIAWRKINSPVVELEEKLSEILGADEAGLETDEPGKEASRDVYLGFRRCPGINDGGNFRGEKTFSAPRDRKFESVYLDGRWEQAEDYIEAGDDAKIFYHFRGSEVYLVAHPGGAIRDIEISVDGEKVPHSLAGSDLRVEDRSFLRVKNPGLFSVLESMSGRSELVLRPEKGTRIYSMTFE